MSRQLLPVIGSSGKTARHQRPHQATRQKRSQRQTSSSSYSHPHPGPPPVLLSDSTMAPWAGLPLSDTSFTSIPPPPPPRFAPPAPPLPPAPQPTPSTPFHERQRTKTKDQDDSCSSSNSELTSPAPAVLQDMTGVGGQGLRANHRVLPQNRMPRPPRLPPLRQVTNLSFSRSFTFSFFELPLHQSPRGRAERVRNVMLLLRQIHY